MTVFYITTCEVRNISGENIGCQPVIGRKNCTRGCFVATPGCANRSLSAF